MRIGEKVFLDGVVYEVLEKVFKPSSGDIDDEDWHGYKVRNTQTEKIEEIGAYSMENYGVSLSMLEERKALAVKKLGQAQREVDAINQEIETYTKILG